jgi:transcription elongation factor GreA
MSYITSPGLSRLQENLKSLKDELIRTFDERSAAAAEGDLKENSAYIFMTERAQVLQTQIEETSKSIKEAQIIPVPTQTSTVALGHLIKVKFTSDNRELTITLVGKHDNALRPGWISGDSPLGLAILDKKAGDLVSVNGQSVEIVSIAIGDIS